MHAVSPAEPPSAVIDTNIWISAFINRRGASYRLLQALFAGQFIAVISRFLLDELMAVSARPNIRRRTGLTDEERDSFVDLLGRQGRWVNTVGELKLCRDSKDNLVLETAILGQAQYLVSRDDDIKRDQALIATLAEHGVEVVTVARMLEIFDAAQR